MFASLFDKKDKNLLDISSNISRYVLCENVLSVTCAHPAIFCYFFCLGILSWITSVDVVYKCVVYYIYYVSSTACACKIINTFE